MFVHNLFGWEKRQLWGTKSIKSYGPPIEDTLFVFAIPSLSLSTSGLVFIWFDCFSASSRPKLRGRHTRDIIFQTCGTFGFANFSDTTNSIWYFDREHYHTIPFHSECVIHCFILQMLNSISATLERIFVCFCVFAWDCVVCRAGQ